MIVHLYKEINLEERGINTDIEKAQVVTKDEVVEQIDTVLHTDLLNKNKRQDLVNDLNTIGENSKVILDSIGTKLNNNKNGNPNAEMGDLEKQSLVNITKAVEQVIKNKENLVLSEADRENKEKLKDTIKDKYADYGVTDVIIIPDGTQLKGEDGEMHSVNGAFSRDGIVYITESTANGSLKDLNRVVGEEVGELYAQNNGLENWNNRGQQIGEIFGEKISAGVDTSKSNNNLSSDDIDLSDIIIGGTNKGLPFNFSGDIKKTVYFDYAQSTLDKKCGGNVECLGGLYGITEEEVTDLNTGNTRKVLIFKTAQNIALSPILAALSLPGAIKTTVAGVKLILDYKNIDTQTVKAYEKEIYKTAVAIIEQERRQIADGIFKSEMMEGISGFAIHGIDNESFKEFNNIRRQQGKKEISLTELKQRVNSYKAYQKTSNVDIYMKYRSMEKLRNY